MFYHTFEFLVEKQEGPNTLYLLAACMMIIIISTSITKYSLLCCNCGHYFSRATALVKPTLSPAPPEVTEALSRIIIIDI